ncbi:replication-relaxation family protein [Saccharopolyspora sp. NPDC003752]
MTDHRLHRRMPDERRPPAPDTFTVLGRLTRRDQALLELLAEHHVLTTQHITALLFPNTDRAQRRLLALFRWHVLDRFRRPGLDDRLTSWRYTLGPLGATILAAQRGTTPPRPGALRTRMLRLAAHPHLDHLLGTHDLFTALSAHARTTPGHELTRWLGERSATGACGALARPDGIGTWTHPSGQITFCLEYDTGTEALTTLITKLTGYTELAHAGGPQLSTHDTGASDRQRHGFWVLFHLPTTTREANLRRRLDTTTGLPSPRQWPAAGVSWGIATTSADHTTHDSPAGEVWLPLGDTHRRTLAALTTA